MPLSLSPAASFPLTTSLCWLLHHGSASSPNLAPDILHLYPQIASLSKLFQLFTRPGSDSRLLCLPPFLQCKLWKSLPWFLQMTSDMMEEEKETYCLQMKGSIWTPQGSLNISCHFLLYSPNSPTKSAKGEPRCPSHPEPLLSSAHDDLIANTTSKYHLL